MISRSGPQTDSFAELRAAFSRQRRGLMASSAAVALFVAFEVSLHELSLLGTRFELGNPSAVTGGLWLVWAYYLIRYLQHFQDLRDDGAGKAFQNALRARMLQLAKRRFETRFLRQNRPFPSDCVPRFEYDESSSEPVPSLGIWAVKFTGTLIAEGKAASKAVVIDNQSETMTPTPKDRARAWLRVAIGTRYFSEYGLPLLIACAPFVALLFRMTGRS